MRKCSDCGGVFASRSRHGRCSKCRVKKKACACGATIRVKSQNCRGCANRAKAPRARRVGALYKIVKSRGYVYVAVRDDESSEIRMRPEHVLVMERILGRPLIRGETVHHRNGVRADNRPENLELWVRPQPSGIRATDAVAWALETLVRYGSIPEWPVIR